MESSDLHYIQLKREVGNRSVSICLTNECNTICRYCSCMPKSVGHGKHLSYKKVSELLLFLAKRRKGFQTVQFTGGEPLEHPHFFDILRLARDLGFIARLQTNGLKLGLLSEGQLGDLRGVAIKVSLDGLCAATHEKYREKGTFKAVIEGINAGLKAGLSIGVRTVFSNHNIDEASEFVPSLHQMGICAWSYNSICPVGFARTMQSGTETNFDYQIHRAIVPLFQRARYRRLLNGTNVLRHLLARSNVVYDKQPWYVWWNGAVYAGQSANFDGKPPVCDIFSSEWQASLSTLHPGYMRLVMDSKSFELIRARLWNLRI